MVHQAHGDGDGVEGVDVSVDAGGDAVGQSQDHLPRLGDHLERAQIHHEFWPLLYLKYVFPHINGSLRLR